MIPIPQNSPPVHAEALADRLAALKLRIAHATAAAPHNVRPVTLLAVSKGQHVAELRAAMALGLTEFGENYVAEALPKIEALAGAGASWHFIGRLQSNKTRAVAEHFAWVHGVDRLRIAQRLSEQRPHHAPPLNICLQVQVANDPGKAGVAPEALLPLARQVAQLPRLQLRGLMCMLPWEAPLRAQHAAFAGLRQLAEAARSTGLPLDTLSMGMSADMEAAIAEGSTIVRIGTALFGPRPHVE